MLTRRIVSPLLQSIALTLLVHRWCEGQATGRVVSYAADAAPLALWHVDTIPMLRLGGPAGGSDPHQEFSRIVGISHLHSGVIVVANAGTNELRYFTSSGAFLTSAGRTGSGPGEFRNLRSLFVTGDTVIAIDGSTLSSKFSATGKLIATIPRIAVGTSPPHLQGYFKNGSAIYDATYPFNQAAREGIVPVFGAFFKVAPDKRVTRMFDSIQVSSMVGTLEGARPEAFQARRLWAISPSGICTMYADRYSIRCMDENGQPTVTIKWDLAVTPLTASTRAAFIKALRFHPIQAEDHGMKPGLEPLFAASVPHAAVMHRSVDDELWVMSYSMDAALMASGNLMAPSEPTNWTVFASDGRMLASVKLPKRFVPFEMGRDYVLGVWRDNDDMEVVTLLRLRR